MKSMKITIVDVGTPFERVALWRVKRHQLLTFLRFQCQLTTEVFVTAYALCFVPTGSGQRTWHSRIGDLAPAKTADVQWLWLKVTVSCPPPRRSKSSPSIGRQKMMSETKIARKQLIDQQCCGTCCNHLFEFQVRSTTIPLSLASG